MCQLCMHDSLIHKTLYKVHNCFIIIFIVFSDKGNLQYHFKGVHEVDEVKCDNCGVVCKNKYSLMVHMKTHRKTPCSFCGNMLSAGTLKKHIRSKHTANHLQPHQCQTCKKGFSTAKRLEMHMNIHTGARPFLCKYCRKSYAHVGNCRMHERTAHEGYKRTDKRKWSGQNQIIISIFWSISIIQKI